MNQSVFKTLEYAKIITMLQNMATSSMGKELAEKLLPSSDIDEVIENLSHTQEASNILISSEPPFGGIHDIRSLLKKTSLGLVIEINSLLDILNTMYAMRNLKKFFKELEIDSPQFKEWAKSIEILGQLEREIDNIVDEHGSMRDSASVELMRIRREIKSSQRRIKTNLDGILKNPDYQKYFQDNIVTIRDERYVIPIKQEYRQQFPGVVHDQSSSGSTLFIEPISIVDLNNDIKQLVIDEKREIERILKVISEKIARNADSLLHNCEIMAQLDFAFAKAKLARKMHATMPEINDEGIVNLAKARHPLLNKDNVVPIDIRLGEGYRTLLITGPNTGGKTVSMKTLGLLVLMTQSGLFIPVQSGSKISIFQNVYADIGDEQSIEQSLSTFSAHMRNIVNILNNIEHDDLLLLDEVGSGTDPEEGAALAMSILERLMEIGACTVATTHYNELKTFAYSKEGIENACVEFDIKSLRPTYRLLIGTPGASNAFAISKRLGLSDTLILRAQQLIKADHAQFENVLNTLENEKLMYEQKNADIAERQQRIEKLEKQLADMKQEMAKKKEQTLRKTKEQCASLLRRTRRESEEIIKELKAQFNDQGMKKRQETIDAARHKLRGRLDKVSQQNDDPNKPGEAVDIKTIAVDDIVYVNKLRQKGTITDISGKELTVQLGSLKMNVKAKDCSFVSHAVKVKETAPSKKAGGFNMLAKVSQISTEVDIRGLMVDEAIEVVSKYLDDAVISGLSRVLIIHGKGTGALRKGIQEYLKNHRNVLSYTLGDMDEGGSGVTAVKLK